jgi:hypothetical protein
MSFNAPNFILTQAFLQTKFSEALEAGSTDAPTDFGPSLVAPSPEEVAKRVSEEIDKYSIVSGFLTGSWGLILPFVVQDQIASLIPKPPDTQGATQQEI